MTDNQQNKENKTTKFDYLFKYIIIGQQAVGKSNLLLMENSEMNTKPQQVLNLVPNLYLLKIKYIGFRYGTLQDKKIINQLLGLIIKIVHVL